MQPILLGVNVDHVGTARQARGIRYPDPVYAAVLAEEAGAEGITMHLREDRRHIIDRDIAVAMEMLQTRLNLEIAVTEEMLSIAEKYKPAHSCFVPEKREELTTEGGLDVAGQRSKIKDACQRLAAHHIEVSLFIDPDEAQIDAAIACGAPAIELHTGHYAETNSESSLLRIREAAEYAHKAGLIVNAGHGLHYHNVQAIAKITCLNELNIGHSIVARAIMVGFKEAVAEMKRLMVEARKSCL